MSKSLERYSEIFKIPENLMEDVEFVDNMATYRRGTPEYRPSTNTYRFPACSISIDLYFVATSAKGSNNLYKIGLILREIKGVSSAVMTGSADEFGKLIVSGYKSIPARDVPAKTPYAMNHKTGWTKPAPDSQKIALQKRDPVDMAEDICLHCDEGSPVYEEDKCEACYDNCQDYLSMPEP